MKQVVNETVNGARIVIAKDGEIFKGILFASNGEQTKSESSNLSQLTAALRNAAGKLHPDYIGINGAIRRFRDFFSEGFSDAAYIEWERKYKLDVCSFLKENLPIEEALSAGAEQALLARKAFGTNILSTYENARIHQVLGSEHGAKFIQAAARFASEKGGSKAALIEMQKTIIPYGRASWPLVTYLPYFWSPESHMFLKPEATRDFARRTGSGFEQSYDSAINLETYDALQNMALETKQSISLLSPADGIDVQSFIWVVGSYTDIDLAAIKVWKAERSPTP